MKPEDRARMHHPGHCNCGLGGDSIPPKGAQFHHSPDCPVERRFMFVLAITEAVEAEREELVAALRDIQYWSTPRAKVRAALKTINALANDVLPNAEEARTEASPEEDALRKMMKDPRYWREHDPAFVERVHQGFKKLFPYDDKAKGES